MTKVFLKSLLIAFSIVPFFTLAGCNSYQVIPSHLKSRGNERLNYQEAKVDPGTYKGQMVVWGGEVVKAARLPDKTRIEVLQMPLNDDFIPAGERAESAGRFFAIDARGEILDPAVVPKGTRITIVGPILNSIGADSGQGSQSYPVISIRDMTVWNKEMSRTWPRPYYGPYYGSYFYGYRPYVFWDGTRVQGSEGG